MAGVILVPINCISYKELVGGQDGVDLEAPVIIVRETIQGIVSMLKQL